MNELQQSKTKLLFVPLVEMLLFWPFLIFISHFGRFLPYFIINVSKGTLHVADVPSNTSIHLTTRFFPVSLFYCRRLHLAMNTYRTKSLRFNLLLSELFLAPAWSDLERRRKSNTQRQREMSIFTFNGILLM